MVKGESEVVQNEIAPMCKGAEDVLRDIREEQEIIKM